MKIVEKVVIFIGIYSLECILGSTVHNFPHCRLFGWDIGYQNHHSLFNFM